MNKKEYLEAALGCEIKVDRVKQVEKMYKVSLDDSVAKIISYADSTDFFDEERRALSYEEIVNASSDLDIDVVEMGFIPLIDSYDCSYIIYLTKENKWARFSTVDMTVYMKRDTLAEVL